MKASKTEWKISKEESVFMMQDSYICNKYINNACYYVSKYLKIIKS